MIVYYLASKHQSVDNIGRAILGPHQEQINNFISEMYQNYIKPLDIFWIILVGIENYLFISIYILTTFTNLKLVLRKIMNSVGTYLLNRLRFQQGESK